MPRVTSEATATATATATDFQIKGLKTSGGDETLRFEVSLYFRGKRVAKISNGGTGGPHEWSWLDREVGRVFDKLLETLTFDFDFEKGDQFIDPLIAKQVETTSLKSKCRKKTLFLLVDEDWKDGYRTVDSVFNPAVKIYLQQEYGARLKEIANERFLS